MQKLILICSCGKRMQIPETALGKKGLCPYCGATIPIREDNTERFKPSSVRRSALKGGLGSARINKGNAGETGSTEFALRHASSEQDQRRFGEAVDLYFAKRYAEALGIFNALAERNPHSPEIENARKLCARALQERMNQSLESIQAPPDGRLTPDFVEGFITNMMLHATSEETQLKAAELACRVLGMGFPASPHPARGALPHGTPLELSQETGENPAEGTGEEIPD